VKAAVADATHLFTALHSAAFDGMTVAIALPETFPPETVKAVRDEVARMMHPGDDVLQHHGHRGLTEFMADRGDPRDAVTPWLLFVDPEGCVRTRDLFRTSSSIPASFRHWARVLRGN
jgi:hypothetical protein